MQSYQVNVALVSLTSPDYRFGMEKDTDSIYTTYIYPNNIENEKRFMNVVSLVSGVK